MLEVYGTKGCGKCKMVKNRLENNGEDFDYILLDDLEESEQDNLLGLAEKEGIKSFPIILEEGKIVEGLF